MYTINDHSSAGKTTLLQVLGARSSARIEGDILFNGQRLNKAVKRRLGFVTQDDVLYGQVGCMEAAHREMKICSSAQGVFPL